LIADEAHNMAAKSVRDILPNIKSTKLIGLSATPKRIYDEDGTEVLNSFFCDFPPYTYEFSLERALDEGFLAEYKYYPKIVELDTDEVEEYMLISKRLLSYFDFKKGEFKKDPVVEMLLLKRKNIIHKAKNKISVFKEILVELNHQRKIQYAFTYVPEGITQDGQSRLIDLFINAAAQTVKELKMNSYTAEDELHNELLRGFTEGKIDMLFAMKMLDEGVDVPRAEIGIFCSSTGNPRQFIQRRGRLLRKHPKKSFATIYDMIVVPSLTIRNSESYAMERNLVKKELQRVAHFASLSMNFYDSQRNLEYILQKYDLNLDQLISEL
jgi:superfamily II DNA or RNA helicase